MSLSSKILIWFSIISITIASITIGISWSFFRTKEKASELSAEVNTVYFKFLKLKNISNDFFALETKNTSFYRTKQSPYLDRSSNLLIEITNHLKHLEQTHTYSDDLIELILTIKDELRKRDSIFSTLSVYAIERGFKDFGMIGKMRYHAHALEKNPYLIDAELLTLRRREKDFLLRHEQQYMSSFKEVSNKIDQYLAGKNPKSNLLTDALFHLNNYSDIFYKVVGLDVKMGLHDNTGLKAELNKVDFKIEDKIHKTLHIANIDKNQKISQLEKSFIITILFVLLISFFLANILSRQITKPLLRLTRRIEGIKMSNFTSMPDLTKNIHTKEIKVLYNEFGQMIDQLKKYQSERDLLIQKLTTSEKKYRETADRLPQGIFETDNRGVLVYVNKVWEDSFGYSKNEAEFNLNGFDIMNRRKKNKSKRKRNEVIAFRQDGSWFPALLYLDKVMVNGQQRGWRGVIIDISERYEYLKLLRTERKKAKESERLKTAFLANISHEIRTPINAIMGFSTLLKNKDFSIDERQNYHNIIEKSSQDLLSVFEDMITVSRIDSDDFKLNAQTLNLTNFGQNQIQITLTKLSKANKEFLDISYLNDGGEVINEIIIDADRVKQIMHRLIDNAIKFTHSGNITLGHKILKSNIIFFVKDSGIGIAEEKQNLIFDPFRQVDESHSRSTAGTGLGLAICKGLIHQLNGNIWIESTPENGASFYFSIPYTKVAQEQLINYNQAL